MQSSDFPARAIRRTGFDPTAQNPPLECHDKGLHTWLLYSRSSVLLWPQCLALTTILLAGIADFQYQLNNVQNCSLLVYDFIMPCQSGSPFAQHLVHITVHSLFRTRTLVLFWPLLFVTKVTALYYKFIALLTFSLDTLLPCNKVLTLRICFIT